MQPEIWANVPLVVRRFRGTKLTELSDILRMHDQMFISILDRAKGIPRRNITVIDIKILELLTFRSLKALLRTVDKSTEPPNYISLPGGLIDSKELVSFVKRLDKKLESFWSKAATKLCLSHLISLQKEHATFLAQFDTVQMDEEGHVYDVRCIECNFGALLTELDFCSYCERSLCPFGCSSYKFSWGVVLCSECIGCCDC
jgi:hypothetical protein